MGINKDQEKYTQNKDSSLARIIVVLIIQVCYFITFPFLSYSFPWSFTNILLISITIQPPFTTSHSISKWPIYKADSPSLPSPFLTKPIVLSNTYYPWYTRFLLSSYSIISSPLNSYISNNLSSFLYRYFFKHTPFSY